MLYSSFGALAFILHIIINYDILFKPQDLQKLRAFKQLRIFLISLLVYYASDICWGLLYDRKLAVLGTFDTYIYFLSMAVSIFLWTRFVMAFLVNSSFINRFLYWIGALILLFICIVLAINVFDPIVFYFDPNGVYYPLNARYLILVIQIVFFFIASVYCIFTAGDLDQKKKLHHMTIGWAGIAMTIFCILQAMDPYLPFYAIGCMIGSCLLHTFLLEAYLMDRQHGLEIMLQNKLREEERTE